MNLKQLKRDISLSKLGIKLDGKNADIINFLNEKLTGLNQYTYDNYPNWLFFGKNKKNIVLDYNKENGHLYIDGEKICSFFTDYLYMKDTDIKEIIQWWVVDTLKLKVNYTKGRINQLFKSL